jgi:hypothetical protein
MGVVFIIDAATACGKGRQPRFQTGLRGKMKHHIVMSNGSYAELTVKLFTHTGNGPRWD